MMRLTRILRLRDLPLFWKLLAPSIALTLLVGVVGTFTVVRYLATEAQSSLDTELSRTSVGASVAISDEADYLVETARVNAHVEGVQTALGARHIDDLAVLLAGAASVRDRADLFVFTDATGTGLVELRRSGTEIVRAQGTAWAASPIVASTLRADAHDVGDETAGLFDDGGDVLLVAAPVTNDTTTLGAALVGTNLGNLAQRVARQVGSSAAFYNTKGALLAASVKGMPTRSPLPRDGQTIRHNGHVGGHAVSTMYAPVSLRGQRVGFVAVSLDRETTLGTLTGVGARVGLVFLAAILIVMTLGAVIARSVLRRMRELLVAHRALAAGELATRADVGGRDEFGELSRGFNVMAEQLEASYRELERRVAERTGELQRLYDESVEAAEARGEFFAAISHELRTPLFVIAGHAELMAHRELQPTEKGWELEFGQTIHQSALELLTRVNDILDLAKLETKKLELHLTDIAIDDLARTLTTEMAPLARQAGLRVRVDVPKDLPRVRADEQRLRDVLRNLLANAIKYTPGGGQIVVTAAQRTKRMVEVSVTDTGIGIPPEAHRHLFEPFYQVPGIKAQTHQTSTGLGLALADRLVVAHGGTMRLKSKVGEGSTFSFTVPASTRTAKASK